MTRQEAKNLTADVGELIILSNGEYSDYTVLGVFRALQPLNAQCITACLPAKLRERYLDFTEIVEAMLAHGLVERVPYHEVYLGAYEFDPLF